MDQEKFESNLNAYFLFLDLLAMDPKYLTEFSQFLAPSARPDLRNHALRHVLSISNVAEGLELIEANDSIIEKALYDLLKNSIDLEILLKIFVNFSASSTSFSSRLLEDSYIVQGIIRMAQGNVSVHAAQILANFSRHFPIRCKLELDGSWDGYFIEILSKFLF